MPENGGAPTSVPSRHFPATAALTPQDRARGVGAIVNIAKKHNLTTAGIYSSTEGFEGIFNSRGLSDWHTQTLAEISITMLGDNSSGWQKLKLARRRPGSTQKPWPKLPPAKPQNQSTRST